MVGKKIGVVLAGKSPLVRIGLTHALYHEGSSVNIIQELECLSGLEKVLINHRPDIAVIDDSFATSEVLELLKILDTSSRIPIVVCSAHSERSYLESILSAGARGFVLTIDPLELLVPAIRRILAGKTYVSERLVHELMLDANEFERRSIQCIEQLGQRELQIFELIGFGYDSPEIQRRLNISSTDFDTYWRSIIQDLGVSNSSELLGIAITWVVQARRGESVQGENWRLNYGPR